MANVEDTLKRIRGHPSLLLIGGGNELYPVELNPPSDISSFMQEATKRIAPGTPFILSSMAPQNYSKPFDWGYAMAPQDGNYGFNLIGDYFEVRNPGLATADPAWGEVPIGFQPEIGAASVPTLRSLQRFLRSAALSQYPAEGAQYDEVGAAWMFHKYEPMLTTVQNDTTLDPFVYDHVYAYGPFGGVDAWAMAANMAQYQQYQALFEGFAGKAFIWYGAVIMWKSQSPWPALRGALYDSFLATTGGFWGTRRATSNGLTFTDQLALWQQDAAPGFKANGTLPRPPASAFFGEPGPAAFQAIDQSPLEWPREAPARPNLHVQVSPKSLTCAVVNRGQHEYPPQLSSSGPSTFTVWATWRFLNGSAAADPTFRSVGGEAAGRFAPTTATACDGGAFVWPASGQTLLLEVALVQVSPAGGEGVVVSRNGYWLSGTSANPDAVAGRANIGSARPAEAPSYADIGQLRSGPGGLQDVQVNGSYALRDIGDGTYQDVTVAVDVYHDSATDGISPRAALWVCVTLLNPVTAVANRSTGDFGEDDLEPRSDQDARVLPTMWSDNCLPALLPGTGRRLMATARVLVTAQASLPLRVEVSAARRCQVDTASPSVSPPRLCSAVPCSLPPLPALRALLGFRMEREHKTC